MPRLESVFVLAGLLLLFNNAWAGADSGQASGPSSIHHPAASSGVSAGTHKGRSKQRGIRSATKKINSAPADRAPLEDPLAGLNTEDVLAGMQENRPWRICLLARWQQTRWKDISLRPRVEGIYEKKGENWRLWGMAYLQYELADVPESGLRSDFDQLYWESHYLDFSMTLGKRVVTWGSADGLRTLDLLNPVDLSDPLVQGSRSSNKKGVWMAQLAWQPSNWNLELSILPIPAVVALPSPGSPWYTDFQRQLNRSGLPIKMEDPQHEPELGFRLCYYSHYADVELIYFHGYQDYPVLTGSNAEQINLGYRKSNIFGLAVQSAMHQSTWRWELNFSPDYVVNLEQGLRRSPRAVSLLGWDYRFNNGINLNLQVYGQYLAQAAAAEQYSDYGISSALSKDDLWGGDLALIYGMVWQISDASSSHQVAATWYFNDQVQWKASINVFTGPDDSTYGQYAEQSLFMLTFKYEL